MSAAEVMKINGHTQMTTSQRYITVNEHYEREGAKFIAAHVAGEMVQASPSDAIK
jgi:hypothetical protein